MVDFFLRKKENIDFYNNDWNIKNNILKWRYKKKVIALAQTYFAIQTRKQEISEKAYGLLTEDEKRFYQRDLTRKGNYSLNQTAKNICFVLHKQNQD